MLIIQRKTDEGIIIGDLIRIKVLKDEGLIKLGIEAPKEINVAREEIYERGNGQEEALREFVALHQKLVDTQE